LGAAFAPFCACLGGCVGYNNKHLICGGCFFNENGASGAVAVKSYDADFLSDWAIFLRLGYRIFCMRLGDFSLVSEDFLNCKINLLAKVFQRLSDLDCLLHFQRG
jgi:hypothetical protein